MVKGLVSFGVLEDAARAGEALPSLATALGADARGGHDRFGLEPTAAALQREDSHTLAPIVVERIVRRKVALRRELFHGD
jgi:hypothetical protein